VPFVDPIEARNVPAISGLTAHLRIEIRSQSTVNDTASFRQL
jgi:hypothetical protein